MRGTARSTRRRAHFSLLSVLLEECGELATAIRREKATAAEEVADVVFCALSIANLLEADVDHLLQEKYLHREFDEVARSWTDLQR